MHPDLAGFGLSQVGVIDDVGHGLINGDDHVVKVLVSPSGRGWLSGPNHQDIDRRIGVDGYRSARHMPSS